MRDHRVVAGVGPDLADNETEDICPGNVEIPTVTQSRHGPCEIRKAATTLALLDQLLGGCRRGDTTAELILDPQDAEMLVARI